jgi:hypothetical protein
MGTKLSVNTCIRQPFLTCRRRSSNTKTSQRPVSRGRLRQFLVDLTVRRALNRQCVGRSHIGRRIVRVARSRPNRSWSGGHSSLMRHLLLGAAPNSRRQLFGESLRCCMSPKHSRLTRVRRSEWQPEHRTPAKPRQGTFDHIRADCTHALALRSSMRPDWDRYTSHHHSSTTHRRAGADVRRREQRRNWAYRRARPRIRTNHLAPPRPAARASE